MDLFAATVTELDRWRRRILEIERLLLETESEEARLLDELAKVEEQAGYYDSLAGEMKRDLQPPSLGGMMRSLRR